MSTWPLSDGKNIEGTENSTEVGTVMTSHLQMKNKDQKG